MLACGDFGADSLCIAIHIGGFIAYLAIVPLAIAFPSSPQVTHLNVAFEAPVRGHTAWTRIVQNKKALRQTPAEDVKGYAMPCKERCPTCAPHAPEWAGHACSPSPVYSLHVST